MPCHAVPCCSVLRAFCCTFRTCHVSFESSSYHRYYLLLLYVPSTILLLNHKKKCSHSSAQPSHSSSMQRRAVPCGAVPCPAVLCRAALCYLSKIQQQQYHGPGLSVHLFIPKMHIRTGDQNVTSPTSTHSTAQGNQLCVSSSWHYQIAR